MPANIPEQLHDLSTYYFHVRRRDPANLISFVRGYYQGDREPTLLRLIQMYLRREYGIEDVINSWIDQIEHLAFERDLDWLSTFEGLLAELKERDVDELPVEDWGPEFTEISDLGLPLPTYTDDQGQSLRRGTIVRLGDRVGEKYRRTKFYDPQLRNPSWSLFYPAVEGFPFTQFFHQQATDDLGPVRLGACFPIFSGLCLPIEDIRERDGSVYVYTPLFEIAWEAACGVGEVELEVGARYEEADRHWVADLRAQLGVFRQGLYTLAEAGGHPLRLLTRQCFKYLNHHPRFEWQRARRSLKGEWYLLK